MYSTYYILTYAKLQGCGKEYLNISLLYVCVCVFIHLCTVHTRKAGVVCDRGRMTRRHRHNVLITNGQL